MVMDHAVEIDGDGQSILQAIVAVYLQLLNASVSMRCDGTRHRPRPLSYRSLRESLDSLQDSFRHQGFHRIFARPERPTHEVPALNLGRVPYSANDGFALLDAFTRRPSMFLKPHVPLLALRTADKKRQRDRVL